MNKLINFGDFFSIVKEVSDTAFTENEEGKIEYTPEGVDFQTRIAVIYNYMSKDMVVDTEGKTKDIDELYSIAYNDEVTDIMDTNPQIKALIKAIDNKINHRLRSMERVIPTEMETALATLFDAITEKINSIDTSLLNEENVKSLMSLSNKLSKTDISNTKEFADAIVSAIKTQKKRATKKPISKTK